MIILEWFAVGSLIAVMLFCIVFLVSQLYGAVINMKKKIISARNTKSFFKEPRYWE